MGLKNIAKKAKVGLRVLREQGIIGLMIVCLQFIQKKVSKKHTERVHAIYTKAKYEDIIEADLRKPPKKWSGTDIRELRLNWLMPPPGKGSTRPRILLMESGRPETLRTAVAPKATTISR